MFDAPLMKSTANAHIVFTIYAKFIKDCANEEELQDLSFQGRSNGSFFQSNEAVTFRDPSVKKQGSREKDRYSGDIKSPLMPPKAETRNREERINSRENRQENKDYNRRDNEKVENRNEQRNEHPLARI